MADLTACYFCSDPTAEEYPVIPPRMDPPDDVQRTVALCPDCHEKLRAILQTAVGFVAESPDHAAEAGPGNAGPATGEENGVWFGGDEAAATEGSATAESGAPATAPESYRKVLRLLQNREFPVDRAEFETVAANAYELSPGEVGAAVDAAVDRGVVAEDAGTLRRPE